MKQVTLEDLILDVGKFSIWDGRGTEVNRYVVDDIEYVQVEFRTAPGKIYTYLVGDENG